MYFIYFMIFVIFVALFAYYKIRYPFVKQINEIVGPDGLPFIGMAYHLHKVPRNGQKEFLDKLFDKFGPLYRIWIGTKGIVHIGNAEYAQKILSSSINIEKSFVYEFGKTWLGMSLPVAPGEVWHGRRKLLNPAFHFSKFNDFIDVMAKNSQIFTERLEKEMNADEFDIFPYIIDCSVDMIAETVMSVQLNTQKGSAKTYAEGIDKFTRLGMYRLLNPLVHSDFVNSFTKNHLEMTKVSADLHKVSSQIIEQRVAERQEKHSKTSQYEREGEKIEENLNGRKCSLLDILLNKYDEKDSSITLPIIREEVDAFMFAGHDTISVALAFTIFLVGHYPEVQDKIHAELDAVFPSEDSPLNVQSIAQLKYLEWAFLDAMRLYPPAPIVARCLKESVALGDHTVPAGTDVFIHIHHIQRSADNFSNPNQFDPLNFSPDRANSIHPYAFTPFSAGPRNCIGQKFARVEAKIALALFFKKYKVTSATKIEDMKRIFGLVAKPEHGIRVKIERRNPSY